MYGGWMEVWGRPYRSAIAVKVVVWAEMTAYIAVPKAAFVTGRSLGDGGVRLVVGSGIQNGLAIGEGRLISRWKGRRSSAVGR